MFSIYDQRGESLITHCRFLDGQCKGDLGGLCTIDESTTHEGVVRVRNCLITGLVCNNNLCWFYSGTTANGRVKVSFENCTIVGNTPTSQVICPYYENASYYWAREQTSVTGCAILFNNGKAAFNGDYANHTNVAYCCAETVGTGDGCGAGNVVYNAGRPLFHDRANGDFRPAFNSQLIDAVPARNWMGDGTRESALDLGTGHAVTWLDPCGASVRWTDARPRLNGAKADIGCCEYYTRRGMALTIR